MLQRSTQRATRIAGHAPPPGRFCSERDSIMDAPAAAALPRVRPANPDFSSGPCAKRPGFTLAALEGAILGRSHRSKGPKAKLAEVIDRSRAILGMPADWRACQGLDDNARVALTEWAWRANRRAGKTEEAEKLLATITEAMKVTDNQSYYRTLLLYKGLRTEADILAAPPDANAVATVSYGLGMWHWLAGRKDQACAAWQRAVSGDNWSAFGFIAAEGELGRGLCKPAKKR